MNLVNNYLVNKDKLVFLTCTEHNGSIIGE